MLTMEIPVMARKKAEVVKPATDKRKPIVAQFRGNEEFGEWIRGLAASEGLPLSSLFDRAVRQYAKSVNYEPPPPTR